MRIARLLVVPLAVVALIVPNSSASASIPTSMADAAIGATVTLTGTFQSIVTDGAGGAGKTYYSLATDEGRVELSIPDDQASGLSGARVRVTGEKQADGSLSTDRSRIVVLGAAPANPLAIPLATPGAANPAITAQKTAVIIGVWSDESYAPVTVAEAQQAFISAPSSVDNFWAATSRGHFSMTTTVLGSWNLGLSQCQGSDGFYLFDRTIAAARQAAANHGKNLAGYNHVVVWMRPPTRSGCQIGWIGMGEVPGSNVLLVMDGPSRDASQASVWPWEHAQAAAHELGHNLGLSHANGLECWDGSAQKSLSSTCASDAYWDGYSNMGGAGSPANALLDSDRLDSLGWLAPTEKKTVNSVGTYNLVSTYSSASGLRLLRIPRPDPVFGTFSGYPSGGYWSLEYRASLTGAFDEFAANAGIGYVPNGVLIRFAQDGPGYAAEGYTHLLDTHPTATNPPGTSWQGFLDAPLRAGETFADPTGGITIRVVSVTASGASVTIGDTEAPSAPGSLVATALTPSGARLDWTAGSDNLGLGHYRIYRDSAQIAEVSAGTLTYTDSYPPAAAHTYTVTALDTAGLESGAASDDVTTVGNPDPPTGLVAVAGNGSAQVSWTAANSHGVSMVGYTVTSSSGGHTCTTAGTWCLVDGLTNGDLYSFTAIATNLVGDSTPSSASNSVTPSAALPGRPTGLTAAPGDASVSLSWTAPADAGSGGPLTGYTATAQPGGKQCTADGSTTACQIAGLTNGTVYVISVIAANSSGNSFASDPVTSTPRTVPGAPTNVTATTVSAYLSGGTETVSWHAPASNGGAPIDSYTATSSCWVSCSSGTPGYLTCTTASLSCDFHDLDVRWPYTFTVVAHNTAGDGPPSAPSAAIVLVGGATYFPVTPARLVDSRSGTHLGSSASLSNNAPVSFHITGVAPLNIPSDAVAVTGNLTAVNEGHAGYFSLTPSKPSAKPTTSTINFPKGDIRANNVTATLGAGGILWVTYEGGSGTHADVVFDVTGYYLPTSAGATYKPVAPARLVDSRAGTREGLSASLSNNSPVSFKVAGVSPLNIPANALAVTGNLTAVNEGHGGYFSVSPAKPSGVPTTSTINFPKGDIRANEVTVRLGSGGVLWITYVGGAGTHADVVFDVTGYYMPDLSGDSYIPITPGRFVDSRIGLGLTGALAHGVTAEIQLDYPGAPTYIGGWIEAITGNLTAVNEGHAGYFTLVPGYPHEIVTPTSTINFPAGDTRANGVTVMVGATPVGRCLEITYVGAPGTHADVVLDITGLFSTE